MGPVPFRAGRPVEPGLSFGSARGSQSLSIPGRGRDSVAMVGEAAISRGVHQRQLGVDRGSPKLGDGLAQVFEQRPQASAHLH